MEFRKAASICLLSFVSATLVLLIARAMDLQATARLEPHLAQIVEELRSLRAQGGLGDLAPGSTAGEDREELAVYYFHSNTRCPTCRSIETQAREAVETGFPAELAAGRVAWKTLNYEEAAGRDLAREFDVQMPVVVLVPKTGSPLAVWKRLDQVWALVGKKPEFRQYVQDEVRQLLAPVSSATAGDPPQPVAIVESPLPAAPQAAADSDPPAAADDLSGIPIPLPE